MLNELFYKGDDLTAPVASLISANTIAGFAVQSGDAVVMGDITGVATTSAAPLAANQGILGYNGVPAVQIAVRVKGIFNLPVNATANIVPGQKVFIDPATGIISDNTAKTWFGWYAPATAVNINAGASQLVNPIKLKM